MIMPNLYSAIMTEEELKLLIEALELCLNNIQYDISMAELDPGYDEQCYCELCDKCYKYEEILNRIKSAVGNEEE